jgi:SPP1 family predicted phage head-tail adaptor
MGFGYKAKELRHRITLQRYAPKTGDEGDFQDQWDDVLKVWGLVETKTGTERFTGNQVTKKWDVKVIVRYREDIEPNWGITFGDRIFKVVTCRDVPDDRPIWKEIYCLEDVPK